ncbi:MAG: bifunctional methylenetetrahydrofolate dehydrogenase/methenyltetrahydrofolate cyclohydrolase FolD [Clostridia bacterium]|nr:bifunctional methylenetetrahydrofolate dehydrogenase/methenyltetrahydrofolate cyclohydrolase FolD [Clostridia bacterium]
MYTLIDGKAVSQSRRNAIATEVANRKAEGLPVPGLAVIIVGNDPASQVYVRNKEKACLEVGFHSELIRLSEETEEATLLSVIDRLNGDPAIHGILVQLPLPKHLSAKTVIAHIDPKKDVDAFHTVNVGKIMLGEDGFSPCTPAGIMTLLSAYGIDPDGKSCVVVGRSNIVGKPMAMLLLHQNATVTIAHSHTKDLAAVTRTADILVVAIGKAKFITEDMVKDGACVIDVGMNRDENGKLCGDVDFERVAPKTSYITPVPGGVGPMTITTLLENTLKAARLS